MCMVAYFATHNRNLETLVCISFVIISIAFTAATYESVFDLVKLEESMEQIGEFDEEAFTKWKNEYAHPLVVRKKRD